jgi:hypothetical protein
MANGLAQRIRVYVAWCEFLYKKGQEMRKCGVFRTGWGVFAGLALLALWAGPAKCGTYGGGTGEPNAPYLIYTPEQMNEIGANPNDWDKHFLLMSDVNLTGFGTSFRVIADWDKPFSGTFDGNDHEILNFSHAEGGHWGGLFRCVDGVNAEIRDLTLTNPDVHGHNYLGSLVGDLVDGRIIRCAAKGGRVRGDNYVGGLVGRNLSSGEISYCCATCAVSGDWSVGGLIGNNGPGPITHCYATGDVIGTNWHAAGLVGHNGYGPISDCHATGDVSGAYGAGGLVGENNGPISRCWATGSASGEMVGGLVGINRGATISNCQAIGHVSGSWILGGLVGHNNGGSIFECRSSGTVEGTGDDVGGLVGWTAGDVSNSCATGSATGDDRVGGLIGKSEAAVSMCYATATTVGDKFVGGLIGQSTTLIRDSFATGTVSGRKTVGGLVGWNYYGSILRCYCAGSVSGSSYVAGMVGANRGTISKSFWDTDTSSRINMCADEECCDASGCTRAAGRTTVEMQTKRTFTDAGWDFVNETANGTEDIWDICEWKNYPKLLSQKPGWEFLCPDINGDLHVDSFDYSLLAARWGECREPGDPIIAGDIDEDGCIDMNDVSILALSWLDCYWVASAVRPNPANQTAGLDPCTSLSWSLGAGALYHDVYIGTDANGVTQADHQSPAYMGTTSEVSFDPCALEYSTEYHWRVDEVGEGCTRPGAVWSFTTWGEPNSHLVGWWRFDEGSESTANDSAGSNHGTLNGDPNWVSGYIGSHALEFDGVDDYVEVAPDSNLNVQYVTMSAWVQVHEAGLGANNFIVNRQMSEPGTYGLWVRASDNKLGAQVRLNGSEDTGRIIISNNAVTSEWTHVCASYDGDRLRLYIDSIPQDDVDDANGTIDTDNPGVLTIGTHPTPSSYLNGSIDDVRIYNRALSGQEIQQLYQE